MATAGKRLLSAEGKRLLNAAGKRRLINGDGDCPECCGEEVVCTECATCCFSDQSTVDLAYDLNNVTTSTGVDFNDDYLTWGATGIPWDGDGATTAWGEAGYSTMTDKWVVGPSCESFPGWYADTLPPDQGEGEELDAHSVIIEIADGDCCGVDGLVADISIFHLERGTVNDEWLEVATRRGTGTLTITVNNNNCCHDGENCQETAGNCDGECPEGLP